MLKLKIVSPERVEFEGTVISVKVPGMMGEFEILDKHAPIVSVLNKGIVSYQTANEHKELRVSAGVVSVKQNQVNVCVEL